MNFSELEGRKDACGREFWKTQHGSVDTSPVSEIIQSCGLQTLPFSRMEAEKASEFNMIHFEVHLII